MASSDSIWTHLFLLPNPESEAGHELCGPRARCPFQVTHINEHIIKVPHLQLERACEFRSDVTWERFGRRVCQRSADTLQRVHRSKQIRDDSARFMSHKPTMDSLVRHDLKY